LKEDESGERLSQKRRQVAALQTALRALKIRGTADSPSVVIA
jgi:hypothetical protein